MSDDGIGFEVAAPASRTGIGLISMNERVRLVGGTLSLSSVTSLGTRVEATIPLSREAVAIDSGSRSVYVRKTS